FGGVEGVEQFAGQVRLGHRRPARGRQPVHGVHGLPADVGRVGADRAQQGRGGRTAGVQQREQQVPGFDGGVSTGGGGGRGRGDDLAALGGEAFGVHRC